MAFTTFVFFQLFNVFNARDEHRSVFGRDTLRNGKLWLAVAAYALSPIDLIPDFIPVLGYLDDLLLLPGLIWLTVRLLPEAVLADCRPQAVAWLDARKDQPRSLFGAALVIALWTALAWYGWSAWQQRA